MDFLLHRLLHEMPENPYGAIAAALEPFAIAATSTTSLPAGEATPATFASAAEGGPHGWQRPVPAPPYGNNLSPPMRDYVRYARIGTIIEEWLEALDDTRPEQIVVASYRYFRNAFRSRTLLGKEDVTNHKASLLLEQQQQSRGASLGQKPQQSSDVSRHLPPPSSTALPAGATTEAANSPSDRPWSSVSVTPERSVSPPLPPHSELDDEYAATTTDTSISPSRSRSRRHRDRAGPAAGAGGVFGSGGGRNTKRPGGSNGIDGEVGSAPAFDEVDDDDDEDVVSISSNSDSDRGGNTGDRSAKKKILILVYSLHGHGLALAEAALEGVHGAASGGVEGHLFRFPEVLSKEAREKMHVIEFDEDDPRYIPEFLLPSAEEEEQLPLHGEELSRSTTSVPAQNASDWRQQFGSPAIEPQREAGDNDTDSELPPPPPPPTASHPSKRASSSTATLLSRLEEYDGFILIYPGRFGGIPAAVTTFFAHLDEKRATSSATKLVGRPATCMVTTATQHGGNERSARVCHAILLALGLTVVGTDPTVLSRLQQQQTQPQQGDATSKALIFGGSPYGASAVAGSSGERMPQEAELELVRHTAGRVATLAARLSR